jgi:outer membrane protein assembly factor BamB
MNRFARLLSLSLLAFSPLAASAGDSWPEFRGPTQQGHSDSTGLPLKWSETENVRWKRPILGEGWSSPVVAGNQIWLTTAIDAPGKAKPGALSSLFQEGPKSLRAMCVDRESGEIVHDVEVFSVEKPESKNSFNSYASPTPVIDGDRVYVCFGTYGSACLDAKTGAVIWKNTDLRINHMEGPGSSPVVYKDLYILHCDGSDAQYVAALNKHDGKLVWKTERTTPFGLKPGAMRKAFCIPLLIHAAGRDQLISVGAYRAFSYDPLTGKEIWSLDTVGFSVAPRPVFGDGLVFLSTGYMTPELWAVRPDGSGDVGATHVAWKIKPGTPLKPSILHLPGRLYFISDKGIARCVESATGKTIWTKRLDGDFSSSPLYADGRIYFSSEQGKTYVLKPGDQFEELAENELPGRILASPAVAGKAIYMRTDTVLYRIEE